MDARKALVQKYKAACSESARAQAKVIDLRFKLNELGPEALDEAKAAKAKGKRGRKAAVPLAVPLKVKAKAKPAPAEAAAAAEAWVCSGLIATGAPCVGGKNSTVRAADTRHDGKLHPTCKACKKTVAAEKAKSRPKKSKLDIVPEEEHAAQMAAAE